MRTSEEKTLARDVDGTVYMVRDWYEGRECDTKSREDILRAIRQLADIVRRFFKIEDGHAFAQKNYIMLIVIAMADSINALPFLRSFSAAQFLLQCDYIPRLLIEDLKTAEKFHLKITFLFTVKNKIPNFL